MFSGLFMAYCVIGQGDLRKFQTRQLLKSNEPLSILTL